MIGRTHETALLRKLLDSDQSEFAAVYGRRRIGKTYLVNEVFAGRITFRAAGIEGASKREQLESFRVTLKQQGHPKCPRLTSWIGAFAELEHLLDSCPSNKSKKVVFLDELPWFDTPRSGFLKAFEHFWNGWASARKDILLVICGSATSWIIRKVLHNRGGLHNRVTRQIPLAPFTLQECEQYAAYKHLGFDRTQILECYMALGGVAYYWSILQDGLSAVQNIDALFFGPSDEMRNEFKRLFASLFRMRTRHVEIVTALAEGRATGLTRDELIKRIGGISGGELSGCLEELEDCGFIRRYNIPGHIRKGAIYQLIDNYTLFYFNFIRGHKSNDEHYWSTSCNEPRANSWRGLAFERICLLHARQIRHALGIDGMRADVYAWRGEDGTGRKAQIDLLFDRADRTISVCEIKYSDRPYALDKDAYDKFKTRIDVFRTATGATKAIQSVLISANGTTVTNYRGNIQREITGDDLFAF